MSGVTVIAPIIPVRMTRTAVSVGMPPIASDTPSATERDPEKLELLNFARGAGQGLSRIVNEVLDFSKMEAGVFMFEEERVDLRALIQSIRMLVGSQQEIGQRRLSIRGTDDFSKLFLSDATRIRQVISNLVNNALHYSTEGPIL